MPPQPAARANSEALVHRLGAPYRGSRHLQGKSCAYTCVVCRARAEPVEEVDPMTLPPHGTEVHTHTHTHTHTQAHTHSCARVRAVPVELSPSPHGRTTVHELGAVMLECVCVCATQVYVSRFPHEATEEQVRSFCASVADLYDLRLPRDPQYPGQIKG